MKIALSLIKLLNSIFDKKKFKFYLFLLSYLFNDIFATNSFDDIRNHLEKGREFLAKGQLNDALSHYHAAIDGDPKNYLTYFKRAAVFLAIGKPKSALDDLNEALLINKDFSSARFRRGSLLLKLGKIDEAHIDFENLLQIDSSNPEYINHYKLVENLRSELDKLQSVLNNNDWTQAISIISHLLIELPWNTQLRETRATCYEKIDDKLSAISDLIFTTKMNNDDTNGYLKLSKLLYDIAEIDESLKNIRFCLKLDFEHKECKIHYKKVKQLVSKVNSLNENLQNENYDECIKDADASYKIESNIRKIAQMILAKKCRCMYKGNKNFDETINVCTEALKFDPNDLNVLCDRAEVYLNNDSFDEAQSDFNHVLNIEKTHQRAKEELKRGATKREIIKQYRKLAAKWHPDNYTDEKEKTKAEKKFIDIAQAKEVLTNEEKRRKFDNGEDPFDQDSIHNQEFNPFSNHEGFVFKFSFG